MASSPDTLHWSNADVEVHKVVVGSYDNNVFVINCRQTGESVLIDAANGHHPDRVDITEHTDAVDLTRFAEVSVTLYR